MDFCGIIAEQRGDIVLADRDRMPGATWFPQARLNFAQNLLRRRDNETAIVALRRTVVAVHSRLPNFTISSRA